MHGHLYRTISSGVLTDRAGTRDVDESLQTSPLIFCARPVSMVSTLFAKLLGKTGQDNSHPCLLHEDTDDEQGNSGSAKKREMINIGLWRV